MHKDMLALTGYDWTIITSSWLVQLNKYMYIVVVIYMQKPPRADTKRLRSQIHVTCMNIDILLKTILRL